jgi:hypothetical protein
VQQLWPRVLAQAVVDPGVFAVANVEHQPFVVTVDGRLQGGDPLPRRKYEIAACSEDDAARAGLDWYVREMDKAN